MKKIMGKAAPVEKAREETPVIQTVGRRRNSKAREGASQSRSWAGKIGGQDADPFGLFFFVFRTT